MTPRKWYAVNVYKIVTSDHRRDRKLYQQVVRAEAPDEEAAVELAKQEFCRLRNLQAWCLRADSRDVVESG